MEIISAPWPILGDKTLSKSEITPSVSLYATFLVEIEAKEEEGGEEKRAPV